MTLEAAVAYEVDADGYLTDVPDRGMAGGVWDCCKGALSWYRAR